MHVVDVSASIMSLDSGKSQTILQILEQKSAPTGITSHGPLCKSVVKQVGNGSATARVNLLFDVEVTGQL